MAQGQPPKQRTQRGDAPVEPISPTVLQPSQPAVADETPIPLQYPSWRTLARWVLVALTLYGIGWLLWQAWSALTPFIIGLVLAYLLTPIVNRLDERLPRWLSILIVYVVGIALIVAAIAYVVPPVVDQVEQLIGNIPSIDQLQTMFRDLTVLYRERVPAQLQQQLDPAIAGAVQSIRENLGTTIRAIIDFVLNQIVTIVNTVTFLIGFLIIPIWLFYILNDQDEGRNFIDRVLHPRIRADFWNTWTMINKVFSDYIRGQLVLCFAVGLAVGVGLFIVRLIGIGVDYILLLAIVAGITEFIPVLGPIIGAIPGIILAFVSAGPQGALAALIVYIVVQQLENNILVPRIVGDSVGVHPAILTVVLIAMGQVFGLFGVILSAPLTAIARDLFIYLYTRLGGSPPQFALATVQRRTKVDNEEPRTVAGDRKAET